MLAAQNCHVRSIEIFCVQSIIDFNISQYNFSIQATISQWPLSSAPMPEQLFARRRPASTPEPPACQETGRGETGRFLITFKKIESNATGWNISRVPARFEACHLMPSLQHVAA
jgi:hypothetical protein